MTGKKSSFDLGVVTGANGKPKQMKILTSIFASVFFTATSAQAQDGPSYEETIAFLQEKVNVQSSSHSQQIIEDKECEFSIVIETLCCGASAGNTITSAFRLRDFDPSKVAFHDDETRDFHTEIVMRASKNNKVVDWSSAQPRHDTLQKRARQAIFRLVRPPSRDNGPRVVRALKHLIRLCGGKEELF